MKKLMNKKYLKSYTAVYFLICAAVFLPFLLRHRSLIWMTDGETQYFPYLYYTGEYLRNFLIKLLHGHFSLPGFDFRIGMGDDIGAVIRFHPLDVLSAVVPGRFLELFYQIQTLLRLYLAGLSFSAFCFYFGRKGNETLRGVCVYLFCGYALILGVIHPTFLSPMIVLPMLLVSLTEVLRGKSFLFFSVMTALGFLSNYYFMYMCSLVLAVVTLAVLPSYIRKNGWKTMTVRLVKLICGYLLGTGMIMAVLLPTVYRLTASLRVGPDSQSGVFGLYDIRRYYQWFLDLISPKHGTGDNTQLNYPVLVLPAFAVLFVKRKREEKGIRAAVLLQVVMLLIPFFGFMMAGFSNINNRWIFIFSLTAAYVTALVSDRLDQPDGQTKKTVTAVSLLYLVTAGYGLWKNGVEWYLVSAVLQTAVVLTAVWMMSVKKVSGSAWKNVWTALLCGSVILNGFMTYDERFGNYASEFIEAGTAFSSYETMPFAAFRRIEDNSFWRADSNLVKTGLENAPIMLDYQGTSVYNSIINSSELLYLKEQENIGLNALHRVFGLDARTVPEALACVKYYMTQGEIGGVLPYGFSLNESLSDENTKIYENEYQLPLGYTYDSWMSRENYESLSAAEKQQVMLEAVVADSAVMEKTELVQKTETAVPAETVVLELPEKGTNMKRTKQGYSVGEGGGSIVVRVERRAGTECYLRLAGLERNKEYSMAALIGDDFAKELTIRGKDKLYSLNIEDYTVNLGYSEESGAEDVEIYFSSKGKYSLEQLEAGYVSMEAYEQLIADRSRGGLRNTEVADDHISGTTVLEERACMVFSIPYSNGWSVSVDGEKRDLICVNSMYAGVLLDAGEHTVELYYQTPGRNIGMMISLLSVCVFVGLLVLRRNCAIHFVLFLIQWSENVSDFDMDEK